MKATAKQINGTAGRAKTIERGANPARRETHHTLRKIRTLVVPEDALDEAIRNLNECADAIEEGGDEFAKNHAFDIRRSARKLDQARGLS